MERGLGAEPGQRLVLCCAKSFSTTEDGSGGSAAGRRNLGLCTSRSRSRLVRILLLDCLEFPFVQVA